MRAAAPPGRSELVGREPELMRLRAAVQRAAAGSPSLVLISGETGVGKTALLRAAAADATTTLLSGACLPTMDDPLPFAPLIQALRRLGNTGTVRQQVGRSPDLARLVPGWAPVESRGDATSATSSTKLALFQSVLELIDKLGAAEPVLHIVEDVHWSDHSTLDLLRYLASNVISERVVILVTYRDHDVAPGSPVASWLAEIGRLPITERLAVERLDTDHARQLAEQLCRNAPDGADPRRVTDALNRSAGNPLFLEHLIRAGSPSDGLPVTLHELLLARVSALPTGSTRLLQALSTIGRPSSAELLAVVLDRPVPTVEMDARPALAQAVLDVRPDGTLGFAHPVFGEVVWSGLLPSERSRLHRRCADIFAAEPDSPPGELARHWVGAGERTQAMNASIAAGDAAERLYAFGDAAAAFARATDLARELGADDARRGLLARTAQADYLAGSTELAIARAREALDAPGQDPPAADLAERLGAYHFVAGRGKEAEEWFLRALELSAGQTDSPLTARVYAGLALLLAGWTRPAEADAWARRGLAAAQATGSRRVEGIVRNAQGMVALLNGDLETAIAHERAALAIATEQGGADDLALAYVNLTHSLGQAGRLDEVATLAREGNRRVTSVGLATQFGGVLAANACEALINAGRLSEAAEVVAEALGREPRGIMSAPALLQAARLAMTRGELEIARDRCERARLILESENAPVAWLRAAAEVAIDVELWAGRAESAYELVVDTLHLIKGTGEEQWGGMVVALGLRALADRADVHRDSLSRNAIRVGMAPLDAAARLAETGLPLDAVISSWSLAERGRLNHESSPERWAAVAASWTRVGHVLGATYSQWREAEARLDAGVDAQAIAALRSAHGSATAVGMPVLVDELDRLARWHRIDLVEAQAQATAEPGGALAAYRLTERELEVLGQLAAGRTNREIADTMFISVKTASVHVSNILRKLEVSGRHEAARIAHRVGMR